MLNRPTARKKGKRRSPEPPAPAITQLQPRPGASSSRLGLRTIPRPAPTPTAPTSPTTTATAQQPHTSPATDHPSPQPPAAGRSPEPGDLPNRRRWLRVLSVLVLILVVAALSRDTRTVYPPPSSPGFRSYELRGYLAISAPAPSVLVSQTITVGRTDDAACWGQSQYSDIQEGAVVTVYDDHDETIAEGYLGPGRTPRLALPTTTLPVCWFPILVKDIPATAAFYQVKIAQRGTIEIDNDAKHGVLQAFPTLDPTDGAAPRIPGHPDTLQPPDANIPTVLPPST